MKEFVINGVKVEAYPLTSAQRIHNFSRLSCPFHQLLNIGTGLYIQQETDFELLRSSIKEAYNRLDSMRLRFIQDENGDVYQYLVPFDDREIELVDFSDWREEDATNEMIKWTKIPFERFNSPMNLVRMIKLPDGYNGIYSKVDHMTMDSSSVITFYSDILQIYCAKRYGTAEPKPMQSYIKCLQKDLAYEAGSPAHQKDEQFWHDIVSSSEPMFTDFNGMGRIITQRREENNPNLRAASIRSENTEASISVFRLEKEPSERIMKFCEKNHIPVVCLLLMGLRTVLSKFNDNEQDVSIKSCVSRRGTMLEKRSGGTRIHFFPVRTIMSPDMTFMDGLKMYQEKQNQIFRHANYDSVAQMMMSGNYWKTLGKTYESLSLTYQPMSMKSQNMDIPDIPYKSMWYTNGVAAQPLYLTVMHRVEDNGLNFNFEYQKAAVTDYEMEYFYYYLCRVIFRGIENSNRTIGEILDMI